MKTLNPAIKNAYLWTTRLGLGIFLLAFALVIYLPSFSGPFQFDDGSSVVINPYAHLIELKPATLFRAAFWNGTQNRPLSNLSLAINYYFGQLNPLGYHVVNFLFFCLTALGIWLLLERLFTRMGFAPARSMLAAWLSVLLWTAHPLNTQAVTYIVQRHASFAGAFSVWSIYFFHLGLEAKKRRPLFYSLCALCGICALLCKETALVLPALIFLYKIYFFDDLKPGWFRRNAKWMIALAVFYALGAAAALRPAMLAHFHRDFTDIHITVWSKFLSAPRSLFWYLYLIIFPFPQFLNLIHEFPLSTGLFHPFTTVVSWAALLAVVFIALVRARTWRIFSFAVLWYLGSLAVEALPLPIDLVNEHRLYLALLSLLVPACAWPVLKGKSLKLVLAWGLVVALFFGSFTFSRNQVWISEVSFWEDVVQKSPNTARAYNNLGTAHFNKGQLDLALSNFSKAIELNSKYANAYTNRGDAYQAKGQLDLALSDYSKAVEMDPKYALAFYNRGFVYKAKGQLDLALSDFSKAIELKPKSAPAYYNRGIAYFYKGQLDLALSDFSKAIEMDPKYADAHNNRGFVYKAKGQLDLAISDYSQAIELDPKLAVAYFNRGVTYKANGQDELAKKDFDKAFELDPKLAVPKR